MILLFLFPIPICLCYHITELFRPIGKFTGITYLPISSDVFLWCKIIRHKLYNFISHCCCICYIHWTLLTFLYQWRHIFTDFIRDNLSMALWSCYMGVSKYCDKSLKFAVGYNLFWLFGIEKGLVWTMSTMEARLPSVVTCIVVYTERCGTKNNLGWRVGSAAMDMRVDMI